jgi:hypothetical protein
MEQHNIKEAQFDSTFVERMRVQTGEYDWLNQLLGSDYASSMVGAPLYHLESARLSQQGLYEHGESSSASVFEQDSTSTQPSSQE